MSTTQTANTQKDTKVNERRRNWRLQRVQTHQPGTTRTHREANTGPQNPGQRDSWWRTTISQFSRQKSFQHPGDANSSLASAGIRMRTNPSRRQSFLYRSGTQLDAVGGNSAKFEGQVNWEREDRQFITPFAQILSILKKAHGILARFKNDCSKKSCNNTPIAGSLDSDDSTARISPSLPSPQMLEETIRDFDWCLEVLESLQCKRSVSSLTRAKFCSMLTRELSTSLSDSTGPKGPEEQVVEEHVIDDDTGEVGSGDVVSEQPIDGTTADGAATGKAAGKHRPYLSRTRGAGLRQQQTHSTCSSQISDYIYQTFVEEDEDEELVVDRFDDGGLDKTNGHSSSALRLNGSGLDAIEVAELEEREPLRRSSGPKDEIAIDSVRCSWRDLVALWKEPNKFNVDAVVQYIEENGEQIAPDFFKLDRLTNRHCLSTFGLYILQKRGILSKLSIPQSQMWLCLQRIEALYTANAPFHNSIHAIDVLHTMHILFTFNQLDTMFSDLEVFASLFACIIHDIDHPGVTNQYLINTNSELALLYNDSSVLENHHLYVAFNLLHAEPTCDFTARFNRSQRQIFRKIVISLVLSTDMSKHMSLLADLKTMVESQRASGSNVINLDTYSSRIQILESLVHASDLGNPTKPLPIYQEWVNRITEEMFRQGDREREAGLEISPMCDRHTACVNTTQVSFIDYIVYPLWEALSELLHPDAKPLLENMIKNREWYAQSVCDK